MRFLHTHCVLVILGPENRHYIVDHHHLTHALHDEGVSEDPAPWLNGEADLIGVLAHNLDSNQGGGGTAVDRSMDTRELATSLCLVHSPVYMFDRSQFIAILAGAAGGATAIGIMEALSITAAFPLVAIPFATSIVVVLGSPKAEPAQPRALIGGHLISTLVGLAIVKICGPAPWAAAVAVGLAMVAMHLTGTFHPPAGIDPLVVVLNGMSWNFLIVPVGVGAVLLALFAFAWHNLVARGANRGDTWPTRWW